MKGEIMDNLIYEDDKTLNLSLILPDFMKKFLSDQELLEKIKRIWGNRDYITLSEILDLDVLEDEEKIKLVLPFLFERTLSLVLCDFAERVLHIFEKNFPEDTRVRETIELRRLYVDGEILEIAWERSYKNALAVCEEIHPTALEGAFLCDVFNLSGSKDESKAVELCSKTATAFASFYAASSATFTSYAVQKDCINFVNPAARAVLFSALDFTTENPMKAALLVKGEEMKAQIEIIRKHIK